MSKLNLHKKLAKLSDLQLRLLTGTVYSAFILSGCFFGPLSTLALVMISAGVCAGEFYFMYRNEKRLPNEYLGILGSVIMPFSIYILGLIGVVYVLIFTLILLIIWYIFEIRASISDVALSLFGVVYNGLMLSSLILMRNSVDLITAQTPAPYDSFWGGIFVVIIFFSISINDGCAYLFGKRLGKHKLAPHISPKKTWEGFIAGLLANGLAWLLLLLIPQININPLQCIAFGLIAGLAGSVGDLFESRVKRDNNVKDSGNLIPGHGGLLDRMDSVFLNSMTCAILLFGFNCIPFI